MSGFQKGYVSFPGYQALSEIEAVSIIEEAPPSFPLGASTGTVCMVGEFERGPLEAPTRVFGESDLRTTFGEFGHIKGGIPYKYPVAAKSAGSTFAWNGNAFVQMRSLKFSAPILCRVDNSAGEVSLSRLATLVSTLAAPFAIEAGDTLSVSVDGGAAVTGTFSATAATITGDSGTYPTEFVGGETLELKIDGNPTQVVTFSAADQSLVQVIDRINSQTASSIASDSASELQLSSRKLGWGASIDVVGGTTLATLGLPAAATQQVATLAITAVGGGSELWTASFDQFIDGQTYTYTATHTDDGTPTEAEVTAGLIADFQSQSIPNAAFSQSGDDMLLTMDANKLASNFLASSDGTGTATFAESTPAVLTLATGTGVVRDTSRVSQSEYNTVVGALTGVGAGANADGLAAVSNTATPGTGTIQFTGGTGLAAFGFNSTDVGQAGAGGIAGTVPAGTLLSDPATGGLWITLEDVVVTADNGGAYSAKVRPAVDDDTAPTSAAAGVTVVEDTLFTEFAVTNALPLSRLTDSQMDSRYESAIDALIDSSGESFNINILVCARVSEVIDQKVRSNCLAATGSGHSARKGAVAPDIGTSRTVALSQAGQGVGNVGREQRVTYCFPGLTKRIPEIAAIGVSGGTGFTEDGIVQVPSHMFYASVRSVLNPEENAGQMLSDTNYGLMPAVALEDAYNREKGGLGLTMQDYIAFKAAGICAPRFDRTAGMVFQSDVTSVSPLAQPAFADNKRRYFGDFLMDTLWGIGKLYEKKLNTSSRRTAFITEVDSFLDLLRSPNQPDASRLEEFIVRDETTSQLRGQGFQILRVAVRQYASMDFIVFRLTSGTTVNIEDIS
jgi:hypothetical protein